ncbi:MAG: hypothetical protein J3K34DRAFT_404350 [Monoraphidium minutum]|nr:MAG: hypothetical protein J3K34DRAFT_404350 [Monoraphidium minutum]
MSGVEDKSSPVPQKKELEAKINTLKVAKAELDHLKPGRAVYQKIGNLFFLSDKARASKSVTDKLVASTAQLDQLPAEEGA